MAKKKPLKAKLKPVKAKKGKKARKSKIKVIKCKKCGNTFKIGSEDDKRKKEWNIVAPMPDKDGNVTITFMATWDCPNCGKNITGSSGKSKGEFGAKPKKDQIADMLALGDTFEIDGFAKSMGVDEVNLSKILNMMIKKGTAIGKIENGMFIPI
ncbi:MAG: hypothetical protein IH840_01255 [Candidatus Heimdallarchaeota archaeon]|nr:hypothetical protein [Candidatus Heimdallarchaeota archaeon]